MQVSGRVFADPPFRPKDVLLDAVLVELRQAAREPSDAIV
jgi:16S rRNA G966 N2-methylase RsmD